MNAQGWAPLAWTWCEGDHNPTLKDTRWIHNRLWSWVLPLCYPEKLRLIPAHGTPSTQLPPLRDSPHPPGQPWPWCDVPWEYKGPRYWAPLPWTRCEQDPLYPDPQPHPDLPGQSWLQFSTAIILPGRSWWQNNNVDVLLWSIFCWCVCHHCIVNLFWLALNRLWLHHIHLDNSGHDVTLAINRFIDDEPIDLNLIPRSGMLLVSTCSEGDHLYPDHHHTTSNLDNSGHDMNLRSTKILDICLRASSKLHK